MLGAATPTVDPTTLVGQEVASFELGLSATGTVTAVDEAPVEAIAEASWSRPSTPTISSSPARSTSR